MLFSAEHDVGQTRVRANAAATHGATNVMQPAGVIDVDAPQTVGFFQRAP